MSKAGLRRKLWAVIAQARRCDLDDVHIEEALFAVREEFSHPYLIEQGLIRSTGRA